MSSKKSRSNPGNNGKTPESAWRRYHQARQAVYMMMLADGELDKVYDMTMVTGKLPFDALDKIEEQMDERIAYLLLPRWGIENVKPEALASTYDVPEFLVLLRLEIYHALGK